MTRAAAALCLLCTAAFAAEGAQPQEGQGIYLEGLLPSGGTLKASRDLGLTVEGREAACVFCHQRSGLGTAEGGLLVPPVTGRFLFRARAHEAAPGDEPLPFVEGAQNREPYTDETLARVIREGIDAQGRKLGPVMPRYPLTDAEMAALIAYLKELGSGGTPGVTDSILHLATVVTPDADPQTSRAMLEVLEAFVEQKNRFPLKPSPKMRTSAKTQYSKYMYMANRRWQLHVWELTGPAETWRAQLRQRMAKEPVYALLSGLAGSTWAPVHAFCEEEGVPCLFPNVEAPGAAEQDFYSLYFSQGVLLEAGLIARSLRPLAGNGPLLVEQIFRAHDSGEAAAKALAAALSGSGLSTHETALEGAPGKQLPQLLKKWSAQKDGKRRALVLWLRPADLAALAAVPAPPGEVFLSGLLGGLERSPVPAAWRAKAHLAYPVDLPSRRSVRLDYALGWFSFRKIPLVAEKVQVDTWLACSLLSEVLNKMADNFARPYLIEQLQPMLDHRILTGYYPRLSLANNQRFASKGGFLVHLADDGRTVSPEGDWVVP
jgi:mono/diheme cytochrome c family protein